MVRHCGVYVYSVLDLGVCGRGEADERVRRDAPDRSDAPRGNYDYWISKL